MSYKKRELYEFKLDDGNLLTLEKISEDSTVRYYRVEDAIKNGQEDTHMNGEVYVGIDGRFRWMSGLESNHYTFEVYGYKGMTQDILDYLNEHGEPA